MEIQSAEGVPKKMSAILFDRLYGRIAFPKNIRNLLNDPALLRLREVSMASVPMFRFPSFTAVARYEHSIGVCHLAEITANKIQLSEKDKTELMLACLYHDVGTPPFAHATEEVLAEKYDFNHEQHLHDLLMGKSDDLGFEKSQIYLGRGLKLHRIVNNKSMLEIGVNIENIAKYAIGKGDLGSLVAGDLDLDNMDNVIRSASSMGLYINNFRLAEQLAKSFLYHKNKIVISQTSENHIIKWKNIRKSLYNHLYADIVNFSLQTMLKHVLRILVNNEENEKLNKYDWALTDNELLEKIKKSEDTNKILINMKLGKVYPCLNIFEISCDNPEDFLKKNIDKIKNISEQALGIECIINYFIDKRERYITRPIISYGEKDINNKSEKKTSIIMGIFSPSLSLEGRSNRKKYQKLRNRSDLPVIISNNLKDQYKIHRVKVFEDKIITNLDV